ncbi:MAG: hypothetical protein J0I41_23880 [Filimonas sp.]|nr:hypothetical protein [Filimonas sp.]
MKTMRYILFLIITALATGTVYTQLYVQQKNKTIAKDSIFIKLLSMILPVMRWLVGR